MHLIINYKSIKTGHANVRVVNINDRDASLAPTHTPTHMHVPPHMYTHMYTHMYVHACINIYMMRTGYTRRI